MSINSKIVVAGFAIFAMVFGSGNIVYPLLVGKSYPYYWGTASLGWLISAVLIHFVGDYSSVLYDADNSKFLRPLGKYLIFIIMLVIMIMVGPFGGMARNVNVSYDCIHSAFTSVDANIFKFMYCILLVVLAWNPGKLVDLIGRIFTPLKFGGVLGVVIMALYLKDSSIPASVPTTSRTSAFLGSLNFGYQTMDMLTAFMAMGIIYGYIKNSLPIEQQNNKQLLLKSSVNSFVVAGSILSIVYIGLIYLGGQYAPLLQDTPNAALFPKIAELAMGPSAAYFVSIVIAVCCLATNIALTTIFSNYLYDTIFGQKINQKILIIITGITTFVMSLLGFDKLSELMGKVLMILYPGLIVFVIARIIYYYKTKSK